MTSPPIGPSDVYAQAISNGQSTVSLANNILQFGQALADAFLKDRADRKVSAATKRRLQRYMGPWYAVFMIDDKFERQPVLKLDAFRVYMERCDGVFRPAGVCECTASWAVLLYALGIEPTTKVRYKYQGNLIEESVVSYKPLDLGQSSHLTGFLEIPGEVICHIGAFFADDVYVICHGGKELTKGSTEFGTISWWRRDEEVLEVRFTQADIESVRRIRQPFGAVGRLMENDTRVPLYLEANHGRYGVSNAKLAWPEVDNNALQIRLGALKSNITSVQKWNISFHDPAYEAKYK